MLLQRIFPSMYMAPDSAPAESRKATLYLLRCIFLMGIRTPPRRFFAIYCLWSFALNLSSTFYQPIGFLTGYISHLSEFSPGEFLTSLQVAFNAWSCSAKVLIVWSLVKRFDQANAILDELDKRLLVSSERARSHCATARSNRIFFVYMTVYVVYATSTAVVAALMGVPSFQNYYPWLDWRASRWQFWLQSGLEYFAMLGACFQDVCVDCYPVNYMLPLRAHMAIFRERLRRLGKDPEEKPEQRYKKLIDCIKHHQVILSYCDVLRPLVGGTIFVQFLVVGMVLGFTIINIVMFANFGSRIAAFSFMCCIMLETTPFCILCNYLTDDCYQLADALFESNWIEQDRFYKKIVLQFLQTLQKPIVFMAGNIFSISVATNLTAMKFSFSVFTLVKQMNIAEKLSKSTKFEHEAAPI
ncbi:odorant receptor 42a [Drosophila virilis]|uniref:Odorant receptor n=1 Tax=Drosophila virilis TaxID=7244 RepID=B4MDZ3_DROVI|nr:odorant receptor 42a [Drosophila virilis]EDW58758.1 uncharacterized protein Dvir_GJ17804 [Drosophila virilis]